MIDMRLLRNGAMLYLALVLASCRNSTPPPIDICIGDGFGGADCQLRAGSELISKCTKNDNGYYCPPSALVNMWMTTQTDEAAFASWAYDTSPEAIQTQMAKIKSNLK